ncbi:GGDEF domain-containing protein [Ensifer soli]|uniref:GGDEF domain-containing protein n=1 Tax=Ciceribacter sp. sgz301302 TaxID=3342379 RepID=UPI0035B6CA82
MGAVTLEDVDRQIARGFRMMRFSTPVERLFLEDYAAQRVRLAPVWALVGTLIYDAVFFGDATMMTDVYSRLAFVRFALFTPFALFAVLALRRFPSARNYDLLALSVAVLGGALPMTVAIASTSPHYFAYQTGNVATFLFFVISLRPRFATVVAGLVLLCAVQFTTVALNGTLDDVTYSGVVTFYLTVAIFLGMSAYIAEGKDRLTFLHQMRGRLLHEELERKSERDALTGLYNRHCLARLGASVWREARSTVALILIDIDRFKLFNDVHGHLEGDTCLKAVAERIAAGAGGTGTAFRFGGEEMLVLLPDTDAATAEAVAQEIRTCIAGLAIRHRGLADGDVVTASLGVAAADPAEMPLDGLIARADAALYEAKRAGRNTVVVAEDAAPRAAWPQARAIPARAG